MNEMSAQPYGYRSGLRQFSLIQPTTVTILHFLQEQSVQPFSYPAVGATKTTPPAGYVVDHNLLQLGKGAACYQAVCAALQRWEMFNLGWLHLCWPTTPIATGATVGVLAQVFGIHILNACRIVYTPGLEVVGVLLLFMAVVGLAGVISFVVLPHLSSPLARFFLTVAAVAMVAAITPALLYGIGEFTGQSFITIPRMVQIHGLTNAFGFVAFGLLGWLVAERTTATQPVQSFVQWEA